MDINVNSIYGGGSYETAFCFFGCLLFSACKLSTENHESSVKGGAGNVSPPLKLQLTVTSDGSTPLSSVDVSVKFSENSQVVGSGKTGYKGQFQVNFDSAPATIYVLLKKDGKEDGGEIPLDTGTQMENGIRYKRVTISAFKGASSNSGACYAANYDRSVDYDICDDDKTDDKCPSGSGRLKYHSYYWIKGQKCSELLLKLKGMSEESIKKPPDVKSK